MSRRGTFMSNKETEKPTHFCWNEKKPFIMDDQFGRDLKCINCGHKLVAMYDPPADEAEKAVALASSLLHTP